MGRDPLGVSPICVQQSRRIEVTAGALGGGNVQFDRPPDERMYEPQRFAGEQDFDRCQPVGCSGSLIDSQPCERGDPAQRHVVAEDRDGPGQRRRARAHPADTDPQGADDGVRCERERVPYELVSAEPRSSPSASSNSCK